MQESELTAEESASLRPFLCVEKGATLLVWSAHLVIDPNTLPQHQFLAAAGCHGEGTPPGSTLEDWICSMHDDGASMEEIARCVVMPPWRDFGGVAFAAYALDLFSLNAGYAAMFDIEKGATPPNTMSQLRDRLATHFSPSRTLDSLNAAADYAFALQHPESFAHHMLGVVQFWSEQYRRGKI